MLQQSMHAANSFLLIRSDNTRHTPWTCLHDHVLLSTYAYTKKVFSIWSGQLARA